MEEFLWALGQVTLFALYLIGLIAACILLLFVAYIIVQMYRYHQEQKRYSTQNKGEM